MPGFDLRPRTLGDDRLRIEQGTERGDLVLELPVLGGQLSKLEPPAEQVAHLEHDGASGDAAVDLV